METSNSFNSARIKGKYEELYHKIGLKIAVDGGKAVLKNIKANKRFKNEQIKIELLNTVFVKLSKIPLFDIQQKTLKLIGMARKFNKTYCFGINR
jgi:hypothetical protein